MPEMTWHAEPGARPGRNGYEWHAVRTGKTWVTCWKKVEVAKLQ